MIARITIKTSSNQGAEIMPNPRQSKLDKLVLGPKITIKTTGKNYRKLILPRVVKIISRTQQHCSYITEENFDFSQVCELNVSSDAGNVIANIISMTKQLQILTIDCHANKIYLDQLSDYIGSITAGVTLDVLSVSVKFDEKVARQLTEIFALNLTARAKTVRINYKIEASCA